MASSKYKGHKDVYKHQIMEGEEEDWCWFCVVITSASLPIPCAEVMIANTFQ